MNSATQNYQPNQNPPAAARDEMVNCLVCGHDITQVRIVRNGIPLLFSACSQCDTSTWASAGETLGVDEAIRAMQEKRDNDRRNEPAEKSSAGQPASPLAPELVSTHLTDLLAQISSANAA